MTVWPVYVEDWQLACCGTHFAVGDRVEWRLALREAPAGFEALAVDFSEAVVIRVHSSGDGFEAVELCAGGLSAWWEGPKGARRGLLTEEHHDREAAEQSTTGLVRRIRVVRQRFAWSQRHRALAPTGDPIDLSDLPDSRTLPSARDVTGMIADLDVD